MLVTLIFTAYSDSEKETFLTCCDGFLIHFGGSNVSFFAVALDSCLDRSCIELGTIEAIVKTASKAKFFIEFHSRCLEGAFSSPFSTL